MYNLAYVYYEHHGHLNIPYKFKTKNGYKKDENGSSLGFWIREQRRMHENGCLSEEKVKKLEEIGMAFSNLIRNEWERMYNLAKAYYMYHGHLKVPRHFSTKNGYEFDKEGSSLGKWINTQYCRNTKGILQEEESEKLTSSGMSFANQKAEKWDKMYALAKAYYEHHGNLRVLSSFKTKNGYEKDENGDDLGTWVNAQRRHYAIGKLSKKHLEELKKIGMLFENSHDIKWDKMYALAKAYYEHHGNLLIASNFITVNGYSYDSKGERLGAWISQQRANYRSGTLYLERQEKLSAIGIIFENMHNIEWERMYNFATIYYDHNHNLKVPDNFKTKDGYTYDANGVKLGMWVSSQRTKYKLQTLSLEQIAKLQAIGMLFDLIKDRHLNQSECIKNRINYLKYKEQIDAIPHREFAVKIDYLNSQGIPLIIDEALHPIFFMSNINIQTRYGVSLESLINVYRKEIDKIKVL